MKSQDSSSISRLITRWIACLVLATASMTVGLPMAENTPALAQSGGYYYIVGSGDTWTNLSERSGISVNALQEANPHAIRYNRWLRAGERLFIPLSEPASPDEGVSGTPSTEATYHVVQSGEYWGLIANRYGLTIRQLQNVNPRSVRAGYILYRGERLYIPPGAIVPDGESAEADSGDADDLVEDIEETDSEDPATGDVGNEDASAEEDDSTDPESDVEGAGSEEAAPNQEDDSPDVEATPEPSEEGVESDDDPSDSAAIDTADDSGDDESTDSASESAEEQDIDNPDSAAGESDSDAADEADAVAEDAESAESELPTDCPTEFDDYPDNLLALLNAPESGVEGFATYLEGCATSPVYETKDFTEDGIDDLVVAYQSAPGESAIARGELIIFNGSENGFEIGYRASAAGEVNLLSTLDINADGQADVSWIDTTCGASTCFDTIYVRSWDGTSWTDWTDGTITMAYAEISLEDVNEDGSLFEIVLNGGLYGSVGAGPQRARVETWGSIDGDPYTLIDRTFNASECRYFAVIDANTALNQGTAESLAQAEELYIEAATNDDLETCWVNENEDTDLRSFSQYRLAVVSAYQGDPATAAQRISDLTTQYPDSIYAEVGQSWLDSYLETTSVSEACAAANDFASENPAAWQILADYGYTNPSFSAEEVCPILEVVIPEADFSGIVVADDVEANSDEVRSGATVSTTASITETESVTNTESISTTENADQDTGTESTSDDESSESDSESDESSADIAEEGTSCPENLIGYEETLPIVLTDADGDLQIVTDYLQECDALDETRGAVILQDFNGDSIEDAAIFPTIISDVGFGPKGTQGSVLIYHGQEDGTFELISAPDVFGQPMPLTVDDVNEDGLTDLIWSITGCSTFCVTEVQMVSWDGESYVVTIAPGATIAEGAPAFRSIDSADDPGQGMELVLNGGVSGTSEGGLSTPHEEIWQSIDGDAYQRIRWIYDREADGANCMGLRLIEADVALQAADLLGYEEAVQLYSEALNPELEACSITGTSVEDELILLQGLATFRLIQAQALGGDVEAATTTLDALEKGQPDSSYTDAASQWLAEYAESGDAAAACDTVNSIFADNEELWQITDQYGYNHPALAAEQICYVPSDE